MKASNDQWKDQLSDRVPAHLGAEIDVFENEIALRRQGKIDERVFAETRLRLVPEKRRLLELLLLRLVRGPRPRIAETPLLVKRLLVMPLLLGLLLLRGPTRIAGTPL